MPRMVAFLRGINVADRRVSGSELKEILAGLGMTAAATYRASGNLMFETDEGDEDVTRGALEAGFKEELGYDVDVLLRGSDALRAVAAHDPFADLDDRGKHQVIFMRAAPSEQARADAAGLVGPDEILDFAGRELHWSPSAGVLDSDIDLDGIERLLGPTTMRTMGTVRGIVDRLG